jgi:hypothetical protein
MLTFTLDLKKRRVPARFRKTMEKSERTHFLKMRDWERMVEDEMSLEELFSLCTNPNRLNEMSLWQRYVLDQAWHQAISARILEEVKALRPWPQGRMFNGAQHCSLPAVPGRKQGLHLPRARYEVLRLCYQEGLFFSAASAYGALVGPPPLREGDHKTFWCHTNPEKVVVLPKGVEPPPELPPKLAGLRNNAPSREEQELDMLQFPLLAEAGWALSYTDMPAEAGWFTGLALLVRPAGQQPHMGAPYRFDLEAYSRIDRWDRAPGQVGPWMNLPPHSFSQPVRLQFIDVKSMENWVEGLLDRLSDEDGGGDE